MAKKIAKKSAAVAAVRKISTYGWKPDIPDQRDLVYSAPLRRLGPLPSKVDLRKQCPAVYDQGDIGSCTANAIAAAIEFSLRKHKLRDFMPSRLFIYYNERSIERSLMVDSGAQIRDGIKSVNKQGVCPEKMWTYDDTAADPDTNVWPNGAKPTQKPSAECYQEALKH
jgi:C1A family cysteine protease